MLREERIISKRMVSEKICSSDGSGERERERTLYGGHDRHLSTALHHSFIKILIDDSSRIAPCLFLGTKSFFEDRQTVSGKQISNFPTANCSMAFCKLEESLFL
jgi:hypothetical protein